ncbi:MAG: hypothetical protein ACYSVY_27775, partial [Planctomycetota bacterium]
MAARDPPGGAPGCAAGDSPGLATLTGRAVHTDNSLQFFHGAESNQPENEHQDSYGSAHLLVSSSSSTIFSKTIFFAPAGG